MFFFFNDTATTEIYTLSLHDALPISQHPSRLGHSGASGGSRPMKAPLLVVLDSDSSHRFASRSEEHTSELQSRLHLVCRLLLEKKKKNRKNSQTLAPALHDEDTQQQP